MRIFLIAALILVAASNVFSADWKTYTNEELYQEGNKALQSRDWLGALKYLFAYQVRVESRRDNMKEEDRAKLLNNIAAAEQWVRSQLNRTCEEAQPSASANSGKGSSFHGTARIPPD